jgi:3-hydroxybutyrate dehydrogenase
LEAGSNVLFADLALRPEARELVSKYQSTPKAFFQRTDVTSWRDLNEMFKVADEQFGCIDIVCPGAGVFEPPFSSFWYPPGTPQSKDSSLGDRYRQLDINLTHPIRVTQMAISYFLAASPPASASNHKTIIHVASTAAESASVPFPVYHATKHAIAGFVYSLADLETLHGIRVAGVCPGVVDTPLFRDNPDKLKMIKEGDVMVTPQQVAKVMLALVKDDEVNSGLIGGSGNSIPIKGGTLIEVLAGAVRDVPLFGNVGPHTSGARGSSLGNGKQAWKDVAERLRPGWGKL